MTAGPPPGPLGGAGSARINAFLSNGAASLGDDRFVYRNFLLDEVVPQARADEYVGTVPGGGLSTLDDWQAHHHDYYLDRIEREMPPGGIPELIDTTDPATCPETFLLGDTLSGFSAADENLDLIRVESVRGMARYAGEPMPDVASGLAAISAGDRDPSRLTWLSALLERWQAAAPQRPLFAAFWEDVADIFDDAADDWPNRLRDRLGLAHHDPNGGPAIPVAVFRYPVRAVPRPLGATEDRRLLHTPTVLDASLWPYFCPVPRECQSGHAVSLSLSAPPPPAREVLHPVVKYKASHFFRMGAVSDAPRESLADARGYHLLELREHSGRDDFATRTDSDIS